MQISSTRTHKLSTPPRSAASTKPLEQLPGDTVTLSSNNSVGGAAIFGGLGLVPLVGFVSDFGIGAQAGVNDAPRASKASGIGALSNLAGTAVTAGGLLFSNSLTTQIGLGLLGVSGAAGAYAGFVAS